MNVYVAIAFILINQTASVPPLHLTIDCSDERIQPFSSPLKLSNYNKNSDFRIHSFCNLIRNAVPGSIQDGKFLLTDPDSDQEGFSNLHVPTTILPPKRFIPKMSARKFKVPKFNVPKLQIPKLKLHKNAQGNAPRVGTSKTFISSVLPKTKEDSSAERMEKLKKGVNKMLHFVKVLGKIDQYVSERIRIIIEKMSKTFAE